MHGTRDTVTRKEPAGLVKAVALRLALVCLLGSGAAIGKPLTEILSYDEFGGLVRECAAKIPELRDFWSWGERKLVAAYLGGGAARGLLHWVYVQLQTHSPAEVRAMSVPSISTFLLQEESDIDLYLPNNNAIQSLKTDVTRYARWDVINDGFFRASAEVGGLTLEKARISPARIEDPLGGVRSYYEGKIEFALTDDVGFRANEFVTNNSRLAQALRTLRMTHNLPEAVIGEQSLLRMRTISDLEMNKLVRNGRVDYWILKALKKLHVSTGKNLIQTLDDLRRADLLRLLAAKGYSVPVETPGTELSDPKLPGILVAKGWSYEDMKKAESVSGNSEAAILKFMQAQFQIVSQVRDYRAIAAQGINPKSDTYIAGVERAVEESFDRFLSLGPSFADVVHVITVPMHHFLTMVGLAKRAVGTAATPAEYRELFAYRKADPSDNYKGWVRAAVGETLAVYAALGASPRDFRMLVSATKADGPLTEKIFRTALGTVKKPEEIVTLFTPLEETAQATEQADAETRVLKEAIPLYLESNPGIAGLKRLERESRCRPEVAIEIMRAGLPLVTKAADYLELVVPQGQPPSQSEIAAADSFVAETFSKFQSKRPSLAQRAELEVRVRFAPKTVKAVFESRLKTADHSQAIERLLEYPRGESAEQELYRDSLIPQLFPKIFARDPDVSVIKRVEGKLRTNELREPFLREALEKSKTTGEIFSLLSPSSTPAAPYYERLAAGCVDRFLSLDPSVGEMEAYRRSFPSSAALSERLGLEIRRRETAAVKSLDDYIRLATPSQELARDVHAALHWVRETKPLFLSLGPGVGGVSQVHYLLGRDAALLDALLKEIFEAGAPIPSLFEAETLLDETAGRPASFTRVLERTAPLLKTAGDFVGLAVKRRHAVQEFLEKHFDEFLKTKPTSAQVIRVVEAAVSATPARIRLIGRSLSAMDTTSDFLGLAEHMAGASVGVEARIAVLGNMEAFFATGPSVDQINELIEAFGKDPADREAILMKAIARARDRGELKGIKIPGFLDRSKELERVYYAFLDRTAATRWDRFCLGFLKLIARENQGGSS